ncbi:uncharacterized protein LOC130591413 [Beta vulgaris subsp. vulgaris]|uniref:uncharacterized protein LOC130591413 n=1 Tax=Beta vulgaris subsp. vulgaris TaxID=3555 RepID=UPI0025483AB6|nr:uncharacterized protein LOC130591413 [Beta vulgaris subsp. vulgaris]
MLMHLMSPRLLMELLEEEMSRPRGPTKGYVPNPAFKEFFCGMSGYVRWGNLLVSTRHIAGRSAEAKCLSCTTVGMMFQKAQKTLWEDVNVRNFHKAFMHMPMNITLITLIPNADQALLAKDFRPIACYTMLYKIIAKVLTNRLVQVIHEVVNPSQVGFIPYNILLAHELMWSFLEAMMLELGFPDQWVDWIMAYVRSVSYSVQLNGLPSKRFQAKKGLRQGNPLSSFLFALRIEYLSRCLGDLKDDPDINFHPKCERIALTHLMFVDDLLLFARVEHSLVTMIMAAFRKFSLAFGLEASVGKRCIHFAGVSTHEANDIATVVSLLVGTLPFKYIGVPLAARKLNFSQSKILVDKITAIAQSWMATSLAYAGII